MKLKFTLFCCFIVFNIAFASAEFYEIKIYTIENKAQEERMNKYLKDAYIPAAHRLGIENIGVFKPVSSDRESYGKLIYVLTPIRTIDQLLTLSNEMKNDENYSKHGADYLDANYQNAPYARFETILLEAFEDAPFLTKPALKSPKNERIYELRSYESPTEKLHVNKVDMFNAGGEITLFDQLGFNAVFYGAVISGANMPNLMYLTTFENQEDRDAHWKSFNESPVWKVLSAETKYKNNVSKNTSFFLYPTDYSDL